MKVAAAAAATLTTLTALTLSLSFFSPLSSLSFSLSLSSLSLSLFLSLISLSPLSSLSSLSLLSLSLLSLSLLSSLSLSLLSLSSLSHFSLCLSLDDILYSHLSANVIQLDPTTTYAHLLQLGHSVAPGAYFDTVTVTLRGGCDAHSVVQRAAAAGVNLRMLDGERVSVSFDETHVVEDLDTLFCLLNGGTKANFTAASLVPSAASTIGSFARKSDILQMEIFNTMHTEHDLLRYLKTLENRDLSMAHSMIALGSCTMKLNATTEMIPITWPELTNIHPFAPLDQVQGYQV